MGRELIRLCDGIKRHGLVDYKISVWEEKIISSRFIITSFINTTRADSTVVLTQCLDLLRTLESENNDRAQADTSTQHIARPQGFR